MICFKLDDEQENLLRDWQENHDCKYRLKNGYRHTGSFGGADTFTFIPTTVEEVVIVKCACGAEIDLSPEHIFFQKLNEKRKDILSTNIVTNTRTSAKNNQANLMFI